MAKKREIAITKGKAGLGKKEVQEVLAALQTARNRGELPALSYEANTSTFFGKDPIYITPKGADLKRTAVKIRTVLRRAFGSKYSVHL